MKKRVLSAFIAVIISISSILCLNSCSQEQEFPVKIGDVTIDEEPEKIVILDKNLADVVSCIGYDIKLVGRSDSVNQAELEVVPALGLQSEPDVDKIDRLETDLVLTDGSLSEACEKQLSKKGIKVAKFNTAQTKKQLKNLYEGVGRVLGGNISGVNKADKAYDELTTTLDNIKNAAEYSSIVKTVCYLYIENGVLKTMNSGTWGGVILEDTGGINVFKNAETDVVNNDELLLSNPDYIFCDEEAVVDYLNNSSTLYTLDGLAENISIIPLEDITMQGYTSLDVLETMLRSMYPDQFSD